MKVPRIGFTVPGKILFASLVLMLLGLLPAASAHAYPTTFELDLKSALQGHPPALTIFFSEGLQKSFTSVKVYLDDKEVDANPSVLLNGNEVSVKLDPLQTGKTYTVKWQAFSTDGHKTQGSFTFGIGKASMAH